MGDIGGVAQGVGTAAAGAAEAGAAIHAADVESDAARYAADLTSKSAENSLNFNQDVFNKNQANQQPYIQAGQGAVGSLAEQVAPGGALNTPYGKEFSYQPFSFSGDVLKNDPAYQFDLDQGQQAIQRSAAAQGGVVSGGALKDLADYTQSNALNAYQTAYNTELGSYNTNYANALQQYQTAYNVWQNDQANSYNRQQGVATLGENAAVGAGSQGTAAANNVAAINSTTANSLGNYATQAGNAAAAGTVGVSNAIGNTVNSLNNQYTNYKTLQALKNASSSSYSKPLGYGDIEYI